MKASKALSIGIYGLFASLPLFLMYVTVATELLDQQFNEQAYSENPMSYFVVLILIGFAISIFSQIGAILLISNVRNKKYLGAAALIAGLVNLLFWILLSLFYFAFYEHSSFLTKILNWPRGLAYFTIFELGSIGYLFLYSQLTFTLFFSLFAIFYRNRILEVRYR